MGLREHAKLLIGTFLVASIIISAISVWHYFSANHFDIPFLWKQESVHGFDNFGTATYKDGALYAPSKGDNRVYALNASTGGIIWVQEVRQCDASPAQNQQAYQTG